MWWVILICWNRNCLELEHYTDCHIMVSKHLACLCYCVPSAASIHLPLFSTQTHVELCVVLSDISWPSLQESMVYLFSNILFFSWQLMTIRDAPSCQYNLNIKKKKIRGRPSEVIYVIHHMIIWSSINFFSVDHKITTEDQEIFVRKFTKP